MCIKVYLFDSYCLSWASLLLTLLLNIFGFRLEPATEPSRLGTLH